MLEFERQEKNRDLKSAILSSLRLPYAFIAVKWNKK